jgi:hypothetical protein
MDTLRYSTWGVVRQCLLIAFVALVIIALFILPSHGSPPAYRRIGPVWTSVCLMLVGYGAIVQAVRTWLLLSNDRIALTLTPQGIGLHGAWTRRSFEWNEIRSVALERRSNRNGHYFVVAIHALAGWKKRYDVRARLLDGSLDAIGVWADKAEAQLLSHGGSPVEPPSGWLSGRLWRWDQSRIAKARLKSVE